MFYTLVTCGFLHSWKYSCGYCLKYYFKAGIVEPTMKFHMTCFVLNVN